MARSACLYEGTIREAIHVFKYANGLRLASFLSGLMADFLKKNNALIQNIDAVTFVPLDGNRLRHRGFNQAKVLASRIAQTVKLPVIDSLDKTMRTSHQSELSRSGRLVNLRDTFRIRNAEDTAGKKILLVDDVMTTGSTLNECSKVLIENGAAEVRCLTLARGI